MYDSRDREQNTHKGIYADVFWTYNAAFGEDKGFNNLLFNAAFRHYVPVYKDKITFAYRVAAQMTVPGNSPFYLNNYYNNLFIQRAIYEGLGGGSTMRGVLRHRVTAPGYAFANVEFRFNLFKFDVKKEHFFVGLNLAQNDPDFDLNDLDNYILFGDQAQVFRPHFAAGIGLRLMMNDNFVLAIDWAAPFDRRDNHSLSSFYVKVGYMF